MSVVVVFVLCFYVEFPGCCLQFMLVFVCLDEFGWPSYIRYVLSYLGFLK